MVEVLNYYSMEINGEGFSKYQKINLPEDNLFWVKLKDTSLNEIKNIIPFMSSLDVGGFILKYTMDMITHIVTEYTGFRTADRALLIHAKICGLI